ERRFQPSRHRGAVALRRLHHIRRWHDAGAQLAHDLLPYLGVRVRFGDVDLLETEPAGLQPIVMARPAIFIEELTLDRTGRNGLWARFHLYREEQRRGDCGEPYSHQRFPSDSLTTFCRDFIRNVTFS